MSNQLMRVVGNIDDQYLLEALPEKYKTHRTPALVKMKYVAAAVIAVTLMGGTTAFAVNHFVASKTEVNQQVLPEIDPMYCRADNDFSNVDVSKTYGSYSEILKMTGADLLESSLSYENPYMQVKVDTDGMNYTIINVNNYILGDTSNYELVEDINLYNCDPGEVYFSTVSLEADIILSEEQAEAGFDTSYMGYYEYADSFVSEKGNKVNILQDSVTPEDYVPMRIAIFVADGVKYTLSGRVSVEEMVRIIDSME